MTRQRHRPQALLERGEVMSGQAQVLDDLVEASVHLLDVLLPHGHHDATLHPLRDLVGLHPGRARGHRDRELCERPRLADAAFPHEEPDLAHRDDARAVVLQEVSSLWRLAGEPTEVAQRPEHVCPVPAPLDLGEFGLDGHGLEVELGALGLEFDDALLRAHLLFEIVLLPRLAPLILLVWLSVVAQRTSPNRSANRSGNVP